MRSLLAALLLLGPALSGCLGTDALDGLRNDLEARDQYEDRVLLSEQVPFTPAGVADPNTSVQDGDAPASRWNETVSVPNGTKSLTVTFRINFTSPEQPAVLPSNPPDGEVRVYVRSPSDEQRNLTRTEPATAGFDFTAPEEGEWTVGMEARGNGTVTFDVDAIVPADAAGSG